MGQTAFVLKWMQAYQSIVTMESSLRLPEKAQEKAGFPWRAFAASLALHALALGVLAPQRVTMPAAKVADRPLSAVLQPSASLAGAVSPAPTFPLGKQARLLPPEPVPRSPDHSPLPTQRTEVQAAAAVATSSAGEARSVPTQAVGAEPMAGALVMAETQGPDAAGLRQYRLALAGEAKRFRRYPESARRTGLSGTAEVRVVVTAGAGGRQTALNHSSGHAVLDEAALEILRKAAERAELPASLRGQSFAVLLPVVFEVED